MHGASASGKTYSGFCASAVFLQHAAQQRICLSTRLGARERPVDERVDGPGVTASREGPVWKKSLHVDR